MKYAVISDTHDNFYNLERTVELIKKAGVTTCFHLGDFCAPGFVRAMVTHYDVQWVCIWGNVDGAKAKIVLEQKDTPNFDIAEESFREFETDSGKIFLTHFPILGKLAALSGQYQAVFYGDNHTKKIEVLDNKTVLVNPGELAGFKTGQPSFAIWDAKTNGVEIVDLTDFRTTR